ncbi:HAD-IA family hydrolase, partial [Acidobacteria bacterium AH-259-D05]|nr:HAD-IA family hydrolase [Acidobacteria bacterium AH-259-D05]
MRGGSKAPALRASMWDETQAPNGLAPEVPPTLGTTVRLRDMTKKRGTKAIFLDVGGTLLDLGEPESAYADILARHDYHSTKEQIRSWIKKAQEETGGEGKGLSPDFTISAGRERARRDELISVFLREAGVEQHFESCRREMWNSWVKEPVFRLFPETLSILSQLKELGFLLGAVSNWEPRLHELCENLGIAHYLDFFLVSEVEGYAKPGGRLFELALERAGLPSEEVIHVGNDLVKDIQAAQMLGIRGVLIERDGSGQSDFSPRISSLNGLVPLVRARAWLRGRVVTGKGEAAAFTQLAWVRQQMASAFGFEPYPGTLNLRLEGREALSVWSELRKEPGKLLEPEPGYCAGRCYPVSVE